MPEISRFYGIVIAMFYNEHNPPHFHASYSGQKVAIDIRSMEVLDGKIPPRAFGLVKEWALLHKDELLKDWELARSAQTLEKIEPLG